MEVRPGYKQTEMGIVPIDWKTYVLEELSERISVGLATSVTKHYRKSGVPIVRNLNIRDGFFDGSDMLFISPEFADANASKAARALDVLTVHTGSHLGQTCVLPFEFASCQTFTTLITTPNKKMADPHFLCLHMSSELGRNEMARLQAGGGKGNLNTGELKKYRIALPPRLDEQRAIATALSDINALLAGLDRLIAKKHDLKQAAMQQLLTGQTRLPGFRREWDVERLGELASIRNQKVMPTHLPPDTLCVELEHIGQGNGRLVAPSTAQHSTSSKYRFFKGDVLFGRLRSYLRKYWLADNAGICTTEIWPLMVDQGLAVAGFLLAVVQSERFIEAASMSYGTHMPRADWGVLRNFEVHCPRVDEQAAIAAVLSDMDAELSALEARRDKTRALKQGMMQELLTGRTRLV